MMECSEGVIQNLKDAGCGETLIDAYCKIANGTWPEAAARGEQVRLLRNYRRELLNRLHEDQYRIDCLDHLLFQLRETGSQSVKSGEGRNRQI